MVLITNKQDIDNHFNYVFNQLRAFKFNNNDRKYQVENHHSVPLNFSSRFVTSHGCLRVLLDLNKDKPLGPSNLPAWALKLGAPQLAKPLCFLFNEYLKAEQFPSQLKFAHITPLFKKGDIDNILNYRAISLTPVLSKVFEKLPKEQRRISSQSQNLQQNAIRVPEKLFNDRHTGIFNRNNTMHT